MKKDQAKILATALYNASNNKKGKELENVANNFSAYLAEHHLVPMISNILAELERIHFAKVGIISAKLTSKEELPQAEIKKITELIKAKTNKEVAVKTEIEENLIGGVVVKYDDKIIDMSIRYQLNNLAKQLSN